MVRAGPGVSIQRMGEIMEVSTKSSGVTTQEARAQFANQQFGSSAQQDQVVHLVSGVMQSSVLPGALQGIQEGSSLVD